MHTLTEAVEFLKAKRFNKALVYKKHILGWFEGTEAAGYEALLPLQASYDPFSIDLDDPLLVGMSKATSCDISETTMVLKFSRGVTKTIDILAASSSRIKYLQNFDEQLGSITFDVLPQKLSNVLKHKSSFDYVSFTPNGVFMYNDLSFVFYAMKSHLDICISVACAHLLQDSLGSDGNKLVAKLDATSGEVEVIISSVDCNLKKHSVFERAKSAIKETKPFLSLTQENREALITHAIKGGAFIFTKQGVKAKKQDKLELASGVEISMVCNIDEPVCIPSDMFCKAIEVDTMRNIYYLKDINGVACVSKEGIFLTQTINIGG